MQLRSHEFSIRRCVVSISRVEAPSGKLHSVNKNLNLWSVSPTNRRRKALSANRA
jgi:hypothetical protein